MRGWDGGKQVKGRKRHILVDVLGLLLKAFVTEANIQDREVAAWLIPLLTKRFPRLKKIWADGGYTGDWREKLNAEGCSIDVEVVKRSDAASGFQVIPKRWIVERTLAWFNHFQRFSKDYEYWVYTADAMLYAVMVRLMLKRLARS